MRRLARHFFTLCAAVSLAVCALWVRSYRRDAARAWVNVHHGDPRYGGPFERLTTSLWSERGVLRVQRTVVLELLVYTNGFPPELRRFFGGFGLVNSTRDNAPQGRPPVLRPHLVVEVPHWALALLTGVLPATHLAWRVRRRISASRRPGAGQCRACGYDLRAGHGRCPECGAQTAG